ncbi:PAS domain S-box protein [Paenibacillus thalictri]|uniref:histidine kinase n=1 Tax=Paenibacillus thalictri TaxID=2527873 RepID=A0A4Q9DG88_9BACL|nr:PAS domain S-box protein [Paenibacillus thalictri]
MAFIAEQVSKTVEISQQDRSYMEDTIGERLRTAAIAAQMQLDPDIEKVTNQQLIELSAKLGVDHITLWKKLDDDIVALKSSDPNEINLSSRTWDYWYTAQQQLFKNHDVTIPQGQKLPHFWSGPINFASSDPKRINKWGYYYDGTTNYLVNPFIHAEVFLDFEKSTGTEAIVQKILQNNPNILEITGMSPDFFGKEPLIKVKKGIPVYNLDIRGVIFGQYTYRDETYDAIAIQSAIKTGEITNRELRLNGNNILKSFIPIFSEHPYVIGITFDNTAMNSSLSHQLFIHCMISLILLIVTMIASYFLSGIIVRPVHEILMTVNQVASGNFSSLIHVSRKDELGVLSSRVNTMTTNLSSHTARLKETAEELRKTKEYLESFVNHTSDAIHVSDLLGNVIQVNIAFEAMYGWAEDEVLGRPLTNIPDNVKEEYALKIKSMLRGESVADYETVRYARDGKLIDVSITISPIRDQSGNIVAVASITRNITARKQTEDVLRQSEKLSIVGQLAAGVAHEIRNPLTTLIGFVQLQKMRGPLSESHLDVMLSELDRINFIVSEFLVLAKPQARNFQPENVGSILFDIVMFMESQMILNNVEIDMRLPQETPLVLCEINQLKQVFINVIKNAMESMPGGGSIIIELTHPHPESVMVRITDHGCGIPEETLNRVGEPFFTSKENGTGLGLMVTQRIIHNHKGSLSIHSKPGQGTTVEIVLPV